jgi:hypothetical protein
MAFDSDYQIAAGNNNAAGLVALQAITPSGNIAFPPPTAKAFYNPGAIRFRGNGQAVHVGFPSQEWLMVWLTYEQHAYLKTTYCGGGYSGAITARTKYSTVAVANYNAVLVVPHESALVSFGWGFKPVLLLLTRLVAL